MYTLRAHARMREVIKLERALVKGNVEETCEAMLAFVSFDDEAMTFDDMTIEQYNECLEAILTRIKTGRAPAGN